MANWYIDTVKYAAVATWVANTSYSVGDLVRQATTPAVGEERVFRCTTAGTSGSSEPTWTITQNGTTNDNGVVWTEVTGQDTYNWSAPFACLQSAVAWGASGDTYYVGHQHNEANDVNINVSFSGTPSNPAKVLCVSNATYPPTALTTGAVVCAGSTVSCYIILGGNIYAYGITWKSRGSASSNSYINIASGDSEGTLKVFERCYFWLYNTYSSLIGGVNLGGKETTSSGSYIKFIDCTYRFGHINQYINSRYTRLLFDNGGIPTVNVCDITTATPTKLFASYYLNTAPSIIVLGLNLDNWDTDKYLADGSYSVAGNTYIYGCKMVSGYSGILYYSLSYYKNAKGLIYALCCDSAKTGYKREVSLTSGKMVDETSIKKTGGASNGTTGYSWKVTKFNVQSIMELPPIAIKVETTGTQKTLTIDFCQASTATALKNNQIWVSLAHPGVSGSVLFSQEVSGGAYVTSPSDCTTSDATWENITNPVKQKISVNFTPQEKGWLLATINLRGETAEQTIYIDPKGVVS